VLGAQAQHFAGTHSGAIPQTEQHLVAGQVTGGQRNRQPRYTTTEFASTARYPFSAQRQPSVFTEPSKSTAVVYGPRQRSRD
jgi:hypothetical protein